MQSDQDSNERTRLLGCLEDLRDSMREMSEMYQPATMMSTVVGHFIRDSKPQPRAENTTSAAQHIDLTMEPTSSLNKEPVTVPPIAVTTRPNSLAPPSLGSNHPLTCGLQSSGTVTPVSGISDSDSSFKSNSRLPFLPSSWFQEMNWEEDTDFLNLMGLKDLQDASTNGEDFMGGLDIDDSNSLYV